MDISFRNKKDQDLYTSKESLSKDYGLLMAKKIVQRILELQAAANPQKLPASCRFHEHIGNRKGLFSLDLKEPYRLIIRPTCNYKNYVDITSVEIYEVMDPH